MKSFRILLSFMAIAQLVMPAQSNLQNDGRGQYNVIIKRYEDCGNENALFNFDFKIQNVSLTSVTVEGRINSNVTFTDQIKLTIALQQHRSRGWKENYMVFDFRDQGICTTTKMAFPPDEIEKLISKIVDQDNRTLTKYCDIPPGVYTFSGMQFDWSGFKAFPEFAYGRYRSKNTLYFQEDEIGCSLTYVDVIPKKKKQTAT